MHEQNGNSWNTGVRVTKTSEDRYTRSASSSSQSSVDEPATSPRSNVYNASAVHQQTVKPDFNRVRFFFLLIFFIIPSFLSSFYILQTKPNR